MAPEEKQNINVRVPVSMVRDLEAIATKNHVWMSDVVRDAIERYLKNARKRGKT